MNAYDKRSLCVLSAEIGSFLLQKCKFYLLTDTIPYKFTLFARFELYNGVALQHYPVQIVSIDTEKERYLRFFFAFFCLFLRCLQFYYKYNTRLWYTKEGFQTYETTRQCEATL